LRISLCLPLALLATLAHGAESAVPPGLQPAQLAIVINDAEPNSIEVGEYYRQAHAIPAANVVHVHIPNRPRKLSMDQFAQLKERIDGQLKPGIQAVLMVWSAPYAVECNSITSAYTLGYDAGQCMKTCNPGKASTYFNSNTGQPFSQLGMRLSMLLPIDYVEEAKAVVDRGTASGFAVPAASAYYLRYFGGTWGALMQMAYLGGAALLLAGVLFSGSLRAKLKVSINKHFYNAIFDYREEWLRFTRALSEDGPALGERTIQAVAQLVESRAGALWILREQGQFAPAASWNWPPSAWSEPASGTLCQFLEARQWVIDVPGCRQHPRQYGGLVLPPALLALPDVWLLVPLMLHGQLFAFVALARPRTAIGLNWEIRDVLKIAGSQAASYLAHRESLDSLMVSRQFESFNRMSTFIVHDLKNLVFQLSLLLSNAEKHRANPAFQEDMLGTLDHSVQKMKTLLQKLALGEAAEAPAPLQLDGLLRQAVAAKASLAPTPQLEIVDGGLTVLAHRARLERVLGHLIQNAIEATPGDGTVAVRLLRERQSAVVELDDTGQGMSEQFIRERLFKPFDTTKTAGMGIGVFESREYIREVGGSLEVRSAPQAGTTFRVILPLHAA